jgi:hypothetical protein
VPKLQDAVVDLVKDLLHAGEVPTPDWLVRPGKAECGRRWPLVQRIYGALEPGRELPEAMRPVERRTVDAVLQTTEGPPRILEVDEEQHFNRFRATTLLMYPRGARLAFPAKIWIQRSQGKQRLEGGGFAAPKPPLFPGENGRHRQRAFRDALCDILPPSRGYLPTLRIADFEVKSWLWRPEARDRMRTLLEDRLAIHLGG